MTAKKTEHCPYNRHHIPIKTKNSRLINMYFGIGPSCMKQHVIRDFSEWIPQDMFTSFRLVFIIIVFLQLLHMLLCLLWLFCKNPVMLIDSFYCAPMILNLFNIFLIVSWATFLTAFVYFSSCRMFLNQTSEHYYVVSVL